MNIEDQLRLVVDALEDVRAKDIKAFDTSKITGLFDRVVIASGNARQTKALADNIVDAAKKAGLQVLAYEGAETGEWVLVDLGDIVIHNMQPAIREYYNLEEIWGEYPIELNLKTDQMPNLSDD
ncbi:ribosome silencing factor [Paenalcaligenes faecalis]|uniref:ribosome silencing factor n=1 Tax=Paenalcaligenes faecalis TaxID=2980099 RepID=UPI0022B959A8|nr:ribosome silencing factor [Paenalcaligenes faecalis]